MSYGSAYSAPSSEDPEYGTSAYDENTEVEDESTDPRKSNFPWWCLPKLRCCYHNIPREIRDKKMRGTIYREYLIWYCSFIAYFTNLVAESYRYHKRTVLGNTTGVDLGISIAILCLVYPTTLFIYFLLYGAARDVGKSWTWWWLLMPVQFCMEIFFAIGIPRTGAGGLVQMIKAFEVKQKSVGFACMVVFLCFLTLAILHITDYIILWRYRTALEGGYVSHKDENPKAASAESQPITKAKEQQKPAKKGKKPSKADKKNAPKAKPLQPMRSDDQESTYQPPEPTSASSGGSDQPAWHQPTGSAYERSGSAYESSGKDTGAYSSSKTPGNPSSANPFGDEGGLDDFYS